VAAAIALAIAWSGIVAFFALWVHRADGNRALTMGLYIFFGAIAWFGFLFGAGGAYRSYLEDRAEVRTVCPTPAPGQTASDAVQSRCIDIESANAIVERWGIAPGHPVRCDCWGVERESFEWAAIGVAMAVGLIPATRRRLARVLPFDYRHWPDVTGLILLLAIAAFSIVGMFYENTLTESVDYLDIGVQAFLLVVLSLFGAGWLVKRSFPETLQRLGLNYLSGREVGWSLLLVLGAFAVSISSSLLVQWLQPDLHERIQENLRLTTDEIDSVWGAVGFGMMTGVSEELLFRGALQPRFGLIFTAFVFALVHMQYGASFVTVGVFGVGILLGLERKHLNTTACVITHAVYNMLVALISTSVG
jgi:membrane protease YdiL (CAAX protease family)